MIVKFTPVSKWRHDHSKCVLIESNSNAIHGEIHSSTNTHPIQGGIALVSAWADSSSWVVSQI